MSFSRANSQERTMLLGKALKTIDKNPRNAFLIWTKRLLVLNRSSRVSGTHKRDNVNVIG